MPGIALAKKPRISWSKLTPQRRRQSRASLRQQHQQLQQSGHADGRRQHPCGEAGVGMPDEQHAMAAISAMLNSSGENAVSAKRPCALSSAHQHGDRSGEGEIGQHQPRVLDGKIERAAAEKTRRDDRDDQWHQQRNHDRDRDQRRADRAEHASGEGGRGRFAVAVTHAQPGRDQRSVQRPLAEQSPNHIDELKRGQKRVGHRARAQTAQQSSNRVQNQAAARPVFPSKLSGKSGSLRRHNTVACPLGPVVIGREPDFRPTGSGFPRVSQSAKQDQGEWLT